MTTKANILGHIVALSGMASGLVASNVISHPKQGLLIGCDSD